jgi:hypothetical protein
MVRRPAWILLILLALVVGAYFLLKSHPFKAASPTPTASAAGFLITQSEGVLQSLRIHDSKGSNFQMQRDPTKTWVITLPTHAVADQGLADEAETQVGALRIVTELTTPPSLSALGLEAPGSTLDLGFVNGNKHKIEVGNLSPTGSGYYVRFDQVKIYIVSNSGIDALLNLLTAPPFPATATPSPTVEVGTPTP